MLLQNRVPVRMQCVPGMEQYLVQGLRVPGTVNLRYLRYERIPGDQLYSHACHCAHPIDRSDRCRRYYAYVIANQRYDQVHALRKSIKVPAMYVGSLASSHWWMRYGRHRYSIKQRSFGGAPGAWRLFQYFINNKTLLIIVASFC
jgi:hypothetical protein